MNRLLTGLLVALLCFGGVSSEVAAKRLGGGNSAGIGRAAPKPAPAAPTAPAAPAATPAPPAAAPAAPAAAPQRSWMGPLAGVAAGLGLAALLGHMGMGGDLGSLVTVLLLAGLALLALRFALQRFGPAAAARSPHLWPVAAAGPAGAFDATAPSAPLTDPPLRAAPAARALPAGFDAAAFERVAKLVFLRMQAANDAANLDDLRRFASPEMFATFRPDLQERRGTAQQTDVTELEAQLLAVVQEPGRQVASVRFRGLAREETGAGAMPFDETWHLARAGEGEGMGDWLIAGIEQNPPA